MSIRLMTSMVIKAAVLASFVIVTTACVNTPYHGQTFEGEFDAPWDNRVRIPMDGYTYEPNERILISQNSKFQTFGWTTVESVYSSNEGTEIAGKTYYHWSAEVWAYRSFDWNRSSLCEDDTPRWVTWLRADRDLGFGLEPLPTFLKNADQCADTAEDAEDFLERCDSPFSPAVKVYYCDQS